MISKTARLHKLQKFVLFGASASGRIEKIRGKKLAESVQQRAIQTGFFLLLLLMFFVLFNDIKGLITGKFDFSKEKQKVDVKKD